MVSSEGACAAYYHFSGTSIPNQMQLSCPTPKLDFDVVTLGHGSGGLLTHRLLNQGVFEILGDVLVNSEHDGACIATDEKMAMSTDSFIVSPIFFPNICSFGP